MNDIDMASSMRARAYRGVNAHALTCMRKSCVKEKSYGPQGMDIFHAVALCMLLFPWLIAAMELQHLPSFVFSILSSALVLDSLVFAAFSVAWLRLFDVASSTDCYNNEQNGHCHLGVWGV